jgi:hypothetical protein
MGGVADALAALRPRREDRRAEMGAIAGARLDRVVALAAPMMPTFGLACAGDGRKRAAEQTAERAPRGGLAKGAGQSIKGVGIHGRGSCRVARFVGRFTVITRRDCDGQRDERQRIASCVITFMIIPPVGRQGAGVAAGVLGAPPKSSASVITGGPGASTRIRRASPVAGPAWPLVDPSGLMRSIVPSA